MNTVITTSGGTVMNMSAVIKDKADSEGHRILMCHVNTLQAKVDLMHAHKTYRGKPVQVMLVRCNGQFDVAAIMDLDSYELQWCAVEDLK